LTNPLRFVQDSNRGGVEWSGVEWSGVEWSGRIYYRGLFKIQIEVKEKRGKDCFTVLYLRSALIINKRLCKRISKAIKQPVKRTYKKGACFLSLLYQSYKVVRGFV